MWIEKTGREDYKTLERDWNEFNDRRDKCRKKNEWLIGFSAHKGKLEVVLESEKFPRGRWQTPETKELENHLHR